MDTKCSLCCFFNDMKCDFGIDTILNDKILNSETEKQIISDYHCNYAYGIKTYEDNKYNLTYEELKQKILDRNSLNFVLYLRLTNDVFDFDKSINLLNAFSFTPAAIIIASNDLADKDAVEQFGQQINIPWRISQKHPDVSEYDLFASSFNQYVQYYPDALLINGYECDLNSFVNEIHIRSKIYQDTIKQLIVDKMHSNIYIFKECFFENRYDWKTLFNNPEEYIKTIECLNL